MQNNPDMLPAHSPIGASSMYRWEACPGSVALCEGLAEEDSPFAAEGTLAHEVAEKILTGKESEIFWDLLPEDMEPAVMVYVNYIRELQSKLDWSVLIERKFNMTKLFPNLYGTADAVAYNPITKIMKVIDYKHGKGVFVDVDDNPQLQYYALGALLETRSWRPQTIETVVVQPRFASELGVIRSHSYDVLDIVDEFAGRLVAAAKRTFEPDAPRRAGAHCKFCRAKGVCPEYRDRKELGRYAEALEDFDVIE